MSLNWIVAVEKYDKQASEGTINIGDKQSSRSN